MLNYCDQVEQGVKPFGEQEIVWTDKVMQSINCRKTSLPERRRDWITSPMARSASWCRHRKGTAKPDSIKVQFSTQPLSSYYYSRPMSMANWNSPMP
jgi:exodeoxyribonuclease V alpha subunit